MADCRNFPPIDGNSISAGRSAALSNNSAKSTECGSQLLERRSIEKYQREADRLAAIA